MECLYEYDSTPLAARSELLLLWTHSASGRRSISFSRLSLVHGASLPYGTSLIQSKTQKQLPPDDCQYFLIFSRIDLLDSMPCTIRARSLCVPPILKICLLYLQCLTRIDLMEHRNKGMVPEVLVEVVLAAKMGNFTCALERGRV
jgi:hypothetical protein